VSIVTKLAGSSISVNPVWPLKAFEPIEVIPSLTTTFVFSGSVPSHFPTVVTGESPIWLGITNVLSYSGEPIYFAENVPATFVST